MELTRRDILGSVLAGGSATVIGTSSPLGAVFGRSERAATLSAETVRTLIAVAEVIYPSEVTDIPTLVTEYARSLPDSKKRAVQSAVDDLRSHARSFTTMPFAELGVSERDGVLRSLGVARALSKPRGTVPERIRYHVVNQLLCGLYTAPKGSRLVGIRNPVGHPGGHESYSDVPAPTRRRPMASGAAPVEE